MTVTCIIHVMGVFSYSDIYCPCSRRYRAESTEHRLREGEGVRVDNGELQSR